MGNMQYSYNILFQKMEERDHSKNRGLEGREKLKGVLSLMCFKLGLGVEAIFTCLAKWSRFNLAFSLKTRKNKKCLYTEREKKTKSIK